MKRTPKYSSLHEWLDRSGKTQKWLAQQAGMTEPHVSMLLRGSRRCSVDKAIRLSKLTGVPVENLVEWPRTQSA